MELTAVWWSEFYEVFCTWQLQDHLSSLGALKPQCHLSHGSLKYSWKKEQKKKKEKKMTFKGFKQSSVCFVFLFSDIFLKSNWDKAQDSYFSVKDIFFKEKM